MLAAGEEEDQADDAVGIEVLVEQSVLRLERPRNVTL